MHPSLDSLRKCSRFDEARASAQDAVVEAEKNKNRTWECCAGVELEYGCHTTAHEGLRWLQDFWIFV